jgi:hypothetical protein
MRIRRALSDHVCRCLDTWCCASEGKPPETGYAPAPAGRNIESGCASHRAIREDSANVINKRREVVADKKMHFVAVAFDRGYKWLAGFRGEYWTKVESSIGFPRQFQRSAERTVCAPLQVIVKEMFLGDGCRMNVESWFGFRLHGVDLFRAMLRPV